MGINQTKSKIIIGIIIFIFLLASIALYMSRNEYHHVITYERHTCLIKSNNFTGKSCLVGGIFYCEDEFETIGFCQKDD